MEKEAKQLHMECSDVEEDSLSKIRSIFLAMEFFIRLQDVSKDPMQKNINPKSNILVPRKHFLLLYRFVNLRRFPLVSSLKQQSVKAAIPRIFPDLPSLPFPLWVEFGAELGCFRAAGISFDQLPGVTGAVGVLGSGLWSCHRGGSDLGDLSRSTTSNERCGWGVDLLGVSHAKSSSSPIFSLGCFVLGVGVLLEGAAVVLFQRPVARCFCCAAALLEQWLFCFLLVLLLVSLSFYWVLYCSSWI
ncbi:hypothetical protein ACOSQ4_004289 [Xanthoceras sorbifolium]